MNPQINLKPLDDAIEWAAREDAGQHVDGDPRWNQGSWLKVDECGTACCIAGRIALAAGWVPDVDPVTGMTVKVGKVRHPESGKVGYVLEVADRIVLGDYADDTGSVPYDIVSDLYEGGNTLDEIRAYRDALARFAAGG